SFLNLVLSFLRIISVIFFESSGVVLNKCGRSFEKLGTISLCLTSSLRLYCKFPFWHRRKNGLQTLRLQPAFYSDWKNA
ncbi:MAG: hypothetical protein Q4E59_05800, partial [Bacteroidales bacterium]|nr:hypothetical protein [Bacteroidales bacterium]